MDKNKRIRCPECGFLGVIRKGKRSGRQRCQCQNCNSNFTLRRKYISDQNRLVWFEQWVVGKQSIDQLSVRSGYSGRTLKRLFYSYLPKCPTWHIRPSEKVNLMIDGTYFPNKVCLVLYRDNNIKATQLYRLTDGEWLDELIEDLNNLLSMGIQIESVTCDGLSNIIKAVRKCSKTTTIQRCLAHIQRETLSWLTRRPKSDAGRELRGIICRLSKIANKDQWGYWVVSLVRWEEKYRDYLNQKSYLNDPDKYWFTHKSVRKSFVHIRRALPDMFHYLDNPDIPKTTNSIESFFGHLKDNLRIHRGLSKQHFRDFVKWYLFFKSNQKKYPNK